MRRCNQKMKVLLLFACISTCGALRCYECSTHDLACQINPKKAATITNRCAFCSTATTMNLGGGKTGVEEETLLREKDASKSALFSGRGKSWQIISIIYICI